MKIDFRKQLKEFYDPPARFVVVDVPEMSFLMLDGQGNPNTAPAYGEGIQWLYSIAYALKFGSKTAERDYVVPPLEALWWSDDMSDFALGRKDKWLWTQMIMVPDFVSPELFPEAKDKAVRKLGSPPATLRLERFHEGLSVQFLHIGPYAEEAATIRRMHEEFIPSQNLALRGRHHEIYLSDPRRVAQSKLKTIVRQPVKLAS